jgi:hypothetical protein
VGIFSAQEGISRVFFGDIAIDPVTSIHQEVNESLLSSFSKLNGKKDNDSVHVSNVNVLALQGKVSSPLVYKDVSQSITIGANEEVLRSK